MGVSPPSRDPFLTDAEAQRIVNEERSRLLQRSMGQSFATDQFFGITDNEPFYLAHRDVDNPKFAWPSKQYTDIEGTTHRVQRGYMRSLITDPNVDPYAKNRRLFFQFNPTVLVRQVQQTPGAMLPLLQSPEQLLQPVPGTATFGFELMFNREHEVNTGDNPPDVLQETLLLPNNQKGFVSEVGVLADIMVLDLITGQGISQDLLATLAKRQSEFILKQDAEEQKYIDSLVGEEGEKIRESYIPTYDESDSNQANLAEIFTKQIGNSAFLNPLPFRVMFSSLFMVEGIATSVDVKFTKFSQKMVPVQCTVTINMYALYIGFAKKNTFLYDNLVQGAIDDKTQQVKDEEVANKLKAGLDKVVFDSTTFGGTLRYANTTGKNAFKVTINADRTSTFTKQIEKKEITDVILRVKMEYAFTTGTSTEPTFLKDNHVYLMYKDSADIPLEKVTEKINEGLSAPDLVNLLLTESKKPGGEQKQYLSYRYVVEIAGKGDNGSVVASPSPFNSETKKFAQVLNLEEEKYERLTANNPFKNKE
jgi:hypothetical protein